MKKLLLIIALMITTLPGLSQTFTNGVYVKNGKTYEVDKKVHQSTTPETFYFSNELIVKTYTNTDFTVNSFFQEVFDLDKLPHTTKFGNYSFAATLMNGSAVVAFSGTNENSSCVISTPLTDLELSKGTFYLIVTDKSVIAVVIEGSLKAHGDKKKVTTATAGSAIVAAPIERGIFEDKVSLDSKRVTVDNIRKLSDEANEIVKLRGQYLFVVIGGKVIGVNIN